MDSKNNAPLYISIAGFGTVASGLIQILTENQHLLRSKIGREIKIRSILVRDSKKDRKVTLPKDVLVTTDVEEFFSHGSMDIFVELIGGDQLARQLLTRALENNIHVVTANKALLAEWGKELFPLAKQHNCHLAFEASVCGGIPILQTLREGLAANKIESITGILNGTSNYILSEMAEKQKEFQDVLVQAQELGYAEADPSLDIGGGDAAHKLALLIKLAWNYNYSYSKLTVQGIEHIDQVDIAFAKSFHYVVKLIAQAKVIDGKIEARVTPTLVSERSLLGQVTGVFNAVTVTGNAVGPVFLHGKGAGALPTGSAVMADILRIVQNTVPNNTGFIEFEEKTPLLPTPANQIRCPYYIRLQLPDNPGVLRDVAAAMADNEISIAKAIQKGLSEEGNKHDKTSVPLLIMTHACPTYSIEKALESLQKKNILQASPVFLPVLEE